MSGLHVDAGNMNSQGINTVSNAESFANEISNLSSNVDSLMSIWRGLAANNFKEAVDGQIVNLNSFRELLSLLGEKISEGARHFDDTEQDNASAASSLF